jgi:hypothetical protein
VVVVVVVVPCEDCTAVAMRTWDSCCCSRTVVVVIVVVMMMVGSCTVEVGHYAAVSLRQRLVDHVAAETMVVSAGVVVEQMGYHHLGRTCIGKIDDSDSSVMMMLEDVWMTVVVVASRIGRMPSYGWEQQHYHYHRSAWSATEMVPMTVGKEVMMMHSHS